MVKYRHCDGSLVVKVTDDKTVRCLQLDSTIVVFKLVILRFLQCLKYRTDQLQDVKKLEKLNSTLMRHMVSKEHKP